LSNTKETALKTEVDLSSLPALTEPGRVVILKSKWYPQLVGSLEATCVELLTAHGVTDVVSHTVPGCLELPLAAADILERDVDGSVEAVICFGVIVKGDTLHFEMISNECITGLGWVMRHYRRPVIVEVLPVFTIEQAQDRAGDDEFNKGIEAAVAAIEMMAWRRGLSAGPATAS
jgi:6,7-dimethyl-8-ribityllumazine synthase